MPSRNKTANSTALIVNKGASRVKSKLSTLTKISKQHKLKLVLCNAPELDSTLRGALKNKDLKRLIVGGGDGTVSLAASLARRLNPKVEIAILPLGTANYYAKSLGVQKNLNQAFDTAMNGEIEERHICRVNKRDFLIGINVGATSRMMHDVTDEEKRKYKKLAYFKGIFGAILSNSTTNVTVKANGKKQTFKSTELLVLNQYINEPIQLMPKVKGSEPYFEIITYGLGRNKLSPLFGVVIFALTFGKYQKYLKRITTTKAKITSDKPQAVAVDGDSIENLPLKLELHKNPIKFVKF